MTLGSFWSKLNMTWMARDQLNTITKAESLRVRLPDTETKRKSGRFSAGIRAIWNFVPAPLTVPERVIIQNEDLACGLSVLSLKLDIARSSKEYA